MSKKILSLLIVLVLRTQALPVPQEDVHISNGLVQARIDCVKSSMRISGIAHAGASEAVIESVYPTYFGYGLWNLFQLHQQKQILDQEEPGFNALSLFDVVRDADGQAEKVIYEIDNAIFRCRRTLSALPKIPVLKLEVEWEANQDTYVAHFRYSTVVNQMYRRFFTAHAGTVQEIPLSTLRRDLRPPPAEWVARTDDSGRNGLIMLTDYSLSRELPMGPWLSASGLSFPYNCHRPIKKGEKTSAVLYLCLFRDRDPATAAADFTRALFPDQNNTPLRVHVPEVHTVQFLQQSGSLSCWRAAPEQIISTAKLAKGEPRPWEIALSVNECHTEQIIINSEQARSAVSLAISDCRDEQGRMLPAASFECRTVKSYQIGNPRLAIGISGEYPDILDCLPHAELEPGKNYCFFLTARFPAGTAPGIYRGKATIAGKDFSHAVPLTIRIRNITLPTPASFKTDFLSGPDRYTTEATRLDSKLYQTDLRSLRITPRHTITLLYDEEGNVKGRPVQNIQNTVGKLHDHNFHIFGPFLQRKFPGLKPLSAEMDSAMANFARVTEQTFQPAGLVDKLLWQLGDEVHDAEKLNIQIHYAKLTRQMAPALPIFTTVNGFSERVKELIACADIIAMHAEIYFHCVENQLDMSGKQLWQYDNGFMTASVPAALVRGIMWRAYKYGITGYHQWSTTAWPADWDFGVDYSGTLYFPPVQGQKTPLRSARLQNFASGVSDYDYFVLLENELRRLGEHPAGKAAAQEFSSIISAVVPDRWTLPRNYQAIAAGRERIAELIEELQKL